MEDNIIYFNNDNEFYDWAVNPNPVINRSQTGIPYFYFDTTKNYQDALNSGKKFCIKDKNSLIKKRGCCCYRSCVIPIENIVDEC